MKCRVELLAEENALVGEGPLWDPQRSILYWTDIQGGRFWEYDPASSANRQLHDGIFVAGVAVNHSCGLAVGTWEGVMVWRSDGDFAWVRRGSHEGRKLKSNDVIADPDGSFYIGTGHLDSCAVLRIRPDGELDIIDDAGALQRDGLLARSAHVLLHRLRGPHNLPLDHDPATTSITGRREFARSPEVDGVPDGMTVDAEGFVCSAHWGAGAVIRFDPDGKEERRIELPATQTSSANFGGPDLDEL